MNSQLRLWLAVTVTKEEIFRVLRFQAACSAISGATIHISDKAGNVSNCITDALGSCTVPPFPIGDDISIEVRKKGYIRANYTTVWRGGIEFRMMLSKEGK